MGHQKHDDKLVEAYEKNVGRPPQNRFEDDPDWNYRGTKEEKEELRERVAGNGLMKNQEKLFDG